MHRAGTFTQALRESLRWLSSHAGSESPLLEKKGNKQSERIPVTTRVTANVHVCARKGQKNEDTTRGRDGTKVRVVEHLKPEFKVLVVVHVHIKAGTNVRANERRDEMKDMKTGGHEKKRRTEVCEGEKR